MPTDKDIKISPISKALPIGETVKDIFFIKIPELGGDKMFWVFESGKVLIMPVYRECPVQIGTMKDLRIDLDNFIHKLDSQKMSIVTERTNTIKQLKGLKKWAGRRQIQ